MQYGSVAFTNQGTYFFSIAVGRLNIESENVIAISLASPIGKLLHAKKAGGRIAFRGTEIAILDVL